MEFLKNVIKLYRASDPQVVGSDLSEVGKLHKVVVAAGLSVPSEKWVGGPREVTVLLPLPIIDIYEFSREPQFQEKAIDWPKSPL